MHKFSFITTYKRLKQLYRISSLQEIINILYGHFIERTLNKKRPGLHRLLLFINWCVDKSVIIERDGQHKLKISWNEPGYGQATMKVRKYSRDLFVFNDFFLARDYDKYISKLNLDTGSSQFIIDAGANIGCSALFWHMRCPQANIICIEPEQSNFALLQENCALTKGKLIPVKAALWNTNTVLELMQRDWSHDGFLVVKGEMENEVIDSVSTVTIPQLMREYKIEVIDLLKIDIEGAEAEIVRDSDHLNNFLPSVNHLLMEVHEEFISLAEMTNILEAKEMKTETIQITGQPIAVLAKRG